MNPADFRPLRAFSDVCAVEIIDQTRLPRERHEDFLGHLLGAVRIAAATPQRRAIHQCEMTVHQFRERGLRAQLPCP